MERNQLLALCETIRAELLPRFPEIANTRFSINTRYRNRNGTARAFANEIELSAHTFLRTSLNDHVANNTIRHELAHIVDGRRNRRRGHGHTWRALAISMGCNGERCSIETREGDEITLTCPCGWSAEYSQKKCDKIAKKNRWWACNKCKKFMPRAGEMAVPAPTKPRLNLFQRT